MRKMGAKELNEYIDNIVATMPESFQKAINEPDYPPEERVKFNIADCELVGFSLGEKTWKIKKHDKE